MSLTICAVSPHDPQVAQLLRQSHALMRSLFAVGDCHFLDIDALCAPEITLFAAERQGRVLGCAALRHSHRYGEVKSMFVDNHARGQGIGRALLAHLEAEARRAGLGLLRLETGAGLDAALRLYAAAGFLPCGPFGDYAGTEISLFFEKRL